MNFKWHFFGFFSRSNQKVPSEVSLINLNLIDSTDQKVPSVLGSDYLAWIASIEVNRTSTEANIETQYESRRNH